MKKKINIEGMSCGHCVGRVTKVLTGIEGVSDVDVNLDEKRALVSLDKEIHDEQFNKEIENVGFKVIGVETVQ
ncbi:MAG TPA: heavy-metal-associated domain-containing protein [Nitrospinota bacterium]|jgi:copper chaperone CopZ|nr:heavy-metal-associated domain-containing protein [Nitrospinota bacterium]|tara:strand:- start:718 stop:936 length:219 start_codon:yes stop_codon:yes gene_type:complete